MNVAKADVASTYEYNAKFKYAYFGNFLLFVDI